MTAAATAVKCVDSLDAFIERASARAYLWSIGEYELHEAVDQLEADAERDGLNELIGIDGVQRILSEAFAPYRCAVLDDSTNDNELFCDICFVAPCFTPGFCNLCREDEARRRRQVPPPTPKSKERPTPRTTIEAIIWCVRERGPQALHETANIDRLSRCDEAAIAEIDRRMKTLGGENAS